MDPITIDIPHHDKPPIQEWLMICLPGGWGTIDLHQLEFTHRPATNAEFFARLKLEYEQKRYQPFPRRRFWSPHGRKITGIRFVNFRLAATVTPLDVRMQEDGPPLGVRLQENKPCLPVEEEGWVCKLDEYPSEAPFGAGMMMWMLRSEEVALDTEDVYDKVPRKLQDALPMERGSEGWGLYFVEEEYWKAWCRVAILGGALVLACGANVVLTLAVQKAFGLAVRTDLLVLLELGVVLFCIAFFHDRLRDNNRVRWNLAEFC